MNKCKTCQHWNTDTRIRNIHNGVLFGSCESENLTEDIGNSSYQPQNLVYPYNEGGYFLTGPEFGCIHHKPLANNE